jgi:hypothetical protein
MQAFSLATRLQCSVDEATALLQAHRRVFARFWTWLQRTTDEAQLAGSLLTPLGWPVRVTPWLSTNSLQNFPMQGGCADLMRVAAILAVRADLPLCGVVHDAFVLEAPLAEIEATVAALQRCIAVASQGVLGGFALRSDATIVRWPDRYVDARGVATWRQILALLTACETDAAREQDCPLPGTDAPSMEQDCPAEGAKLPSRGSKTVHTSLSPTLFSPRKKTEEEILLPEAESLGQREPLGQPENVLVLRSQAP